MKMMNLQLYKIHLSTYLSNSARAFILAKRNTYNYSVIYIQGVLLSNNDINTNWRLSKPRLEPQVLTILPFYF